MGPGAPRCPGCLVCCHVCCHVWQSLHYGTDASALHCACRHCAGSSVGGSASKTAQAPSKHSAQRSARSAQRTSSVRKRDRLSKALQQQQLKRRRTQQSARMWRQRKSLPVYAQRQHIMKTIAANQVTIISGVSLHPVSHGCTACSSQLELSCA